MDITIPAFDPLLRGWDLGAERASAALRWLIEVVLRSAAAGDRPPG